MPVAPARIRFAEKIPAAVGTPEPLFPTPVMASSVRLIASRGRAANTGTVFLGHLADNDTQKYPLAPGAEIEIESGEDEVLDLSQIYVDAATLTDGVQIVYVQAARY